MASEQSAYIQELWNKIPLSRQIVNVESDLSDGVLVAEFVSTFTDELVDLERYLRPEQASSEEELLAVKLANWQRLAEEVFRPFGYEMSQELIAAIVMEQPGVVQDVTAKLQVLLSRYLAQQIDHDAQQDDDDDDDEEQVDDDGEDQDETLDSTAGRQEDEDDEDIDEEEEEEDDDNQADDEDAQQAPPTDLISSMPSPLERSEFATYDRAVRLQLATALATYQASLLEKHRDILIRFREEVRAHQKKILADERDRAGRELVEMETREGSISDEVFLARAQELAELEKWLDEEYIRQDEHLQQRLQQSYVDKVDAFAAALAEQYEQTGEAVTFEEDSPQQQDPAAPSASAQPAAPAPSAAAAAASAPAPVADLASVDVDWEQGAADDGDELSQPLAGTRRSAAALEREPLEVIVDAGPAEPQAKKRKPEKHGVKRRGRPDQASAGDGSALAGTGLEMTDDMVVAHANEAQMMPGRGRFLMRQAMHLCQDLAEDLETRVTALRDVASALQSYLTNGQMTADIGSASPSTRKRKSRQHLTSGTAGGVGSPVKSRNRRTVRPRRRPFPRKSGRTPTNRRSSAGRRRSRPISFGTAKRRVRPSRDPSEQRRLTNRLNHQPKGSEFGGFPEDVLGGGTVGALGSDTLGLPPFERNESVPIEHETKKARVAPPSSPARAPESPQLSPKPSPKPASAKRTKAKSKKSRSLPASPARKKKSKRPASAKKKKTTTGKKKRGSKKRANSARSSPARRGRAGSYAKDTASSAIRRSLSNEMLQERQRKRDQTAVEASERAAEAEEHERLRQQRQQVARNQQRDIQRLRQFDASGKGSAMNPVNVTSSSAASSSSAVPVIVVSQRKKKSATKKKKTKSTKSKRTHSKASPARTSGDPAPWSPPRQPARTPIGGGDSASGEGNLSIVQELNDLLDSIHARHS